MAKAQGAQLAPYRGGAGSDLLFLEKLFGQLLQRYLGTLLDPLAQAVRVVDQEGFALSLAPRGQDLFAILPVLPDTLNAALADHKSLRDFCGRFTLLTQLNYASFQVHAQVCHGRGIVRTFWIKALLKCAYSKEKCSRLVF